MFTAILYQGFVDYRTAVWPATQSLTIPQTVLYSITHMLAYIRPSYISHVQRLTRLQVAHIFHVLTFLLFLSYYKFT